MRLLLFTTLTSLILIEISCNVQEKNAEIYHDNMKMKEILDTFVRPYDTIFFSIKMDSNFQEIGETIFVFEKPYYRAFSNKEDSIFFTSDIISTYMEDYIITDSLLCVKVLRDKDSLNNQIKIENIIFSNKGTNFFILTYDKIEKSNSYIIYNIVEKSPRLPMSVDISIEYQTHKITKSNINLFNIICRSFSYEIRSKLPR